MNPRHTKKGTTETANPWTQVVANWSGELADRLGRSEDTLSSAGLRPADFPPDRTVEIRFADGSHAKFHRAFALISEKKGRVAVFTQHCGYLEFQLAPGMEVVQITEEHYQHEGLTF